MKRYYFLIAIGVSLVLQVALVPAMSIRWFRPDLPLLVIVYLAIRRGGLVGITGAFFTGLLVDSFSTNYLGLSSLSYSLAAFIPGRFFYSPDRVMITRWLHGSAYAVVIYSITFSFFYTLTSTPSFWTLLFHHALPTAFYTWSLGAIWGISPLFIHR